MGVWGYKPFQNDSILDAYGGLDTLDNTRDKLYKGIKIGEGYCIDAYEIAALLLRSFNVKNDIIVGVEDEREILNAINSRNFTNNTKQSLQEISGMLFSTSAISLDERKKMLKCAVNTLRKLINKQYKGTYFDIPTFDEDDDNLYYMMWTGNPNNEQWKNVKEIYNDSVITIRSNFSDVVNPICITEEQLNWLISEREAYGKKSYAQEYKKNFAGGTCVVNFSNNEKLAFNPTTLALSKWHDLVSDIRDLPYIIKKHDLTNADCEVSTVDAESFFKTNFPNGFILNDISQFTGWYGLISIDKKGDLLAEKRDEGTKRALLTTQVVKLIAQIVPIYRSKQEAKAALTKKASESKVKAPYHAVKRLYGKANKIIGYVITDGTAFKSVESSELKRVIASNANTKLFDNLTLTSDGKLYMKD